MLNLVTTAAQDDGAQITGRQLWARWLRAAVRLRPDPVTISPQAALELADMLERPP